MAVAREGGGAGGGEGGGVKERKRKGLVLDMFPTLELDNCFLLDNCESEIERQMERTRGQGEREKSCIGVK